MRLVAAKSPIPVALDEELIGVYTKSEKRALIASIAPAYLVLKPTLLGGFQECNEWIELAEEAGVQWWVTSYLESNVGLNAIGQFVANFDLTLAQGLGTGGLYENNIHSPLKIEAGKLRYDRSKIWGDI